MTADAHLTRVAKRSRASWVVVDGEASEPMRLSAAKALVARLRKEGKHPELWSIYDVI